jgi:hypothetical protein
MAEYLTLRAMRKDPRNPGPGFVNLWFNKRGNLMFEDSDGHTREIDTAAFQFGSAPASSSSTGKQGDVRIVDPWMYICIATNTWRRLALGTF